MNGLYQEERLNQHKATESVLAEESKVSISQEVTVYGPMWVVDIEGDETRYWFSGEEWAMRFAARKRMEELRGENG